MRGYHCFSDKINTTLYGYTITPHRLYLTDIANSNPSLLCKIRKPLALNATGYIFSRVKCNLPIFVPADNAA